MQTPKRVSCNRCKTKKIACNRVYPCCDKCEAVDADCTYLPRKVRAKNRSHVNNLNHPHVLSDILRRLERLESQCLSREDSGEAGDESDSASASVQLAPLNDADNSSHDPQGRDNSSNLLFSLRYAGARLLENGWVIDALNDAVQKIKALQNPESQCPTDIWRSVSKSEAKNWVKLFFKTYQFEGFHIPLQEDFVLSIPELLENVHVSLDPTCLLIYYHVLFHGSLLDESTQPERAVLGLHFYRISLGVVEEWFDRIQNSEADLYAAISALSTLMDFCNIELAWKMLGYACSIANALGYFTVDSPFPTSLSPGNEQNTRDLNRKRLLFWYLVRTDCQFRLHFGKPPVMEAGSWAVNMPDPAITGSDNVSSHSIQIHFLATMRLTLSMMKYLNLNALETIQNPTDLENTVDDLTAEIMTVMSGWEPDRLLSSAENQLDHWLSSDILFDGYKALIITHQSKCLNEDERGLSTYAVSMARKSITTMRTLVDLKPQLHWGMSMIILHQVIPFAIMCSNIVGTPQHDEIDDDLALVNWIAEFSKVAAADRVESQPLIIIIDSLYAACKRASENIR